MKLAEIFLNIVTDALRYMETEDVHIKDRLVDELDTSFSLLHTLSMETESPYTYAYIDLITDNKPHNLITLLESDEPCLQGVPENLEKWRSDYLRRLSITYHHWRSHILNAQLRLYFVVAFNKTGLLSSLRMSSYNPLPYQRIQGSDYDNSISRSLDDARKIVKYYWQAKYKLSATEVDKSLQVWAIEWGSSLLAQFRDKPIIGESFTFAFTILFFLSSLRQLAEQESLTVRNYKNNDKIEPHQLILPTNIVASGAFLRNQIPDESLTPKTYKTISTQKVADVQIKLDVLYDVNLVCEESFIEYFLIPKDNYFEIQNQSQDIAVVPIENLDDLITKFFPDWLVVGSKELPKQKTRVDVKNFIEQALLLTKQLRKIHRQNRIYKYLTIDCVTSLIGQIKLIDPGEANSIALANSEKTVAYIAPEQSDYYDSIIDHRTDFYSLGIVFYQMLTTKLPFNSKNVRDLIISHIAQKVIPPCDLTPQIPAVLSDIIMKMIAKNPDDRYKSAQGIVDDLEVCKNATENNRPDVYETLVLSKKLYGRDSEYNTLHQCWLNFLEGNNEIVMIHGMPGIGKTTLVNSLLPQILLKDAFFLSGKYQKDNKERSQNALIQIAQKFCTQILSNSPGNIAKWREKIKKQLGGNISVVVETVPGFENLVGEQPPSSKLPPEESRNRFYLTMERLFYIIVTNNQKTVIFLDDIQWMDDASIPLLEKILGRYPQAIFYILASRNSNCKKTKQLREIISEKKHGFCEISLNTLSEEFTKNVVCHLLSPTQSDIDGLSRLIFKKTMGNPLFSKQFLQVLWQKKLLSFDKENRSWNWKIANIKRVDFSCDVLESLRIKTSQLPKEEQRFLQICACFSDDFSAEMLGSIIPEYRNNIVNFINSSLQNNYFVATQAHWVASFEEQKYHFSHDLVRESIHQTIDKDTKQKINYKIGLYYSKNRDNYPLSSIVHYWNRCTEVLENIQKFDLAELNFKAVIGAKNSASYDNAMSYISTIKMLANKIQLEPKFLRKVQQQEAEIAYLNKDFEQAEKQLLQMIDESNDNIEIAKVHVYLVILYTHMGNWDQSFLIGKKGLSYLGIDWSKKLPVKTIAKEFFTIKAKLRKLKNNPHCFVDLPKIDDEEQRIALQLLSIFMNTTYYGGKIYALLTALKMVNITLKKGVSVDSPNGYGYLAMLLGHVKILGDYGLGRQFMEWAIELSEIHNNPLYQGRVYFAFGSVVNHWTKELNLNLQYLQKAKEYSLQSGDIIFASYATVHPLPICFFSGENLDSLFSKGQQALDFLEDVRFNSQEFFPLGLQKFITQISDIPLDKMTKQISINQYKDDEQDIKNLTGIIWLQILELKRLYLQNNYDEALKIAKEAQRYIDGAFGQIMEPEYYYYYTLTLLALYPRDKKFEVSKKIKKNLGKLNTWKNNCPQNFAHKYFIVKSEIFRVRHDFLAAMKFYQQAIAETEKTGFTHQQALANELAAYMYLQLGIEDVAQMYLQQCISCYKKWGATAKVRQLSENFSESIDLVVRH
ncbi:AAA family ATPase [Candidatus Uabimicrobium sp. HlEnr_7]|uniref:AAA family ATPase n=1 Tax=Candidatus Uabimicrobium helgolandensis TaxID=3095367 RepID=UPI0035587073